MSPTTSRPKPEEHPNPSVVASLPVSSPPPPVAESRGTADASAAGGSKKRKKGSGDNEPPDEAKLKARREANRMHAFKSRQRSKFLLTELQQAVSQLNREKAELERQNAVLTAQGTPSYV